VLDGLDRSTHALLATVRGLDDDQIHAPCNLPDWTRAEVVAHLTETAHAFRRCIQAGLAGRRVAFYPGGAEEREAGILAGRDRSARELAVMLDDACAALADTTRRIEDWERPVELTDFPTATIRRLILLRWTEVEVHHADLGTGYTPADWPPDFVDAVLPLRVEWRLPLQYVEAGIRGSWHLHRTDGDGEWTLYATDAGVRLEQGHAKGDCAVRGPGWALLAFVLGRPTADALEVFGDTGSFKAVFPGP
jgi:maleylpyruvate isomerase